MERSVRARLNARREGRKFGFTVGTAFGILAGILFWREHLLPAQIFTGFFAVLFVGAIAVPAALKPVERTWMAMAHLISKVTTPIVMGIVYFLVVTPIGVIFRMTKGNPLVHEPDPANGYWIAREQKDASSIDMRRQF